MELRFGLVALFNILFFNIFLFFVTFEGLKSEILIFISFGFIIKLQIAIGKWAINKNDLS